MRRRGHTLVELLVALVLLQVGILAAVGTCLLAARLVARAELLEWGAAEAQRTLDSLALHPLPSGAGEAASGPGTLRWTVGDGGGVVVEYLLADTALLRIEGRLGAGAGTGG